MERRPQSRLEQNLQSKLTARKSKSTFRQLSLSPPGSADFSSNDFLSLSTSSELRTAFLRELNQHHARFPIGSGGSRLLDGNSQYADELEREIAQFHGAQAGLIWNSGFDANSGVFACIPQPDDIIIHDELIHASVHDGMRLSRASKCLVFRHNDVDHLRSLVTHELAHDPLLKAGTKNVFIAIESVYSMDGDVTPLQEIVHLKHQFFPQGNAHIILDEAHGTGVLGPQGKGLVAQLGLEHETLIRLHTFGKSLACSGAITLCSPLVRSYLINYARPLIYTTFMPFPLLAAIKAAYSLFKTGHMTDLLKHLNALTARFHLRITSIIQKHNASRILTIPSICPQSPIFALSTQDARELASHCHRAGFVVRAVVPPTVPTRRVRVCLHAGNTMGEVEGFVRAVEEWLLSKLASESSSTPLSSTDQRQQQGVDIKARL